MYGHRYEIPGRDLISSGFRGCHSLLHHTPDSQSSTNNLTVSDIDRGLFRPDRSPRDRKAWIPPLVPTQDTDVSSPQAFQDREIDAQSQHPSRDILQLTTPQSQTHPIRGTGSSDTRGVASLTCGPLPFKKVPRYPSPLDPDTTAGWRVGLLISFAPYLLPIKHLSLCGLLAGASDVGGKGNWEGNGQTLAGGSVQLL